MLVLMVALVGLVGCVDEDLIILDNPATPTCPLGAWCEFHNWNDNVTLLNYSDVNETIVVRYNVI